MGSGNRSRRRLTPGVMALLAILGCQHPIESSGLRLALEVPQEVAIGEEVTFIMRVTNSGRSTLHLRPNGLPTGFEILVLRDDGARVWSSLPDDGTIADTERYLKLARGESVTFEATWSQQIAVGVTAPPGKYLAIGVLREDDRAERTVRAGFAVR